MLWIIIVRFVFRLIWINRHPAKIIVIINKQNKIKNIKIEKIELKRTKVNYYLDELGVVIDERIQYYRMLIILFFFKL
jgi:hypothetical protein